MMIVARTRTVILSISLFSKNVFDREKDSAFFRTSKFLPIISPNFDYGSRNFEFPKTSKNTESYSGSKVFLEIRKNSVFFFARG